MKYVMFIVLDPDHTEADAAAAPDIEDWFAFAREHGNYDIGIRLGAREQAKTLRVRGGETLVTDGPFAETKETVAGFALIEAADIDEALELARRNPAAYWGRVEVRPVHSFGGPLLGED